MSAAAAAIIPAVISAVGAGASATSSGMSKRKARVEQKRQFDLSFAEQQLQNRLAEKQFKQRLDFDKQQAAWAQKWGDIMNQQQRNLNSQEIQLGSPEIKTERLANKIKHNQLMGEANAMKNLTLGKLAGRRSIEQGRKAAQNANNSSPMGGSFNMPNAGN
jgi:hypothetical protein